MPPVANIAQYRVRSLQVASSGSEGSSEPLQGTNLHDAAESNAVDRLEALLDKGVDHSALDERGAPPLHAAVGAGALEATRCLLRHGASVDAVDDGGATALLVAAGKGSPDVVLCLLEAGAILDATDNEGEDSMKLACRYGHSSVVALLLERGWPLDATAAGAVRTATKEGHARCIEVLLSTEGLNPNACDHRGIGLLQLAAREGHLAACAALLAAGAVDVADKAGRTAGGEAEAFGHTTVRELLEVHAGKENQPESPTQVEETSPVRSPAKRRRLEQRAGGHNWEYNSETEDGAAHESPSPKRSCERQSPSPRVSSQQASAAAGPSPSQLTSPFSQSVPPLRERLDQAMAAKAAAAEEAPSTGAEHWHIVTPADVGGSRRRFDAGHSLVGARLAKLPTAECEEGEMRNILKALVGSNYVSTRVSGGDHTELLIQPAMLHYKGGDGYISRPNVSDKHLAGLTKLLQARGGLQAATSSREYFHPPWVGTPPKPAHPAAKGSKKSPKSAKKGIPKSAFSSEALMESLAPPSAGLPREASPDGLALPLYPYQEEALYWMLARESREGDGQLLHPMWEALHLPERQPLEHARSSAEKGANQGGKVIYQNRLTGTMCSHRIDAPLPEPGGCLADEMGLGKTAMILALILAHPRDFAIPDVSRSGALMMDRSPGERATPVKATLVVLPTAIVSQWGKEAAKWAPGLHVHVYRGGPWWQADSMIQEFSRADIVLTTYEQLQQGTSSRSGGLLLVQWWRVVLDEAQMVFNTQSKAAMMASELWRVNGWCSTGTPIGTGLDDIHGLLVFLDHDPFADGAALNALVTKPYEARDPVALEELQGLLKRFMLRRTKKHESVAAQLVLPPVEDTTIFLKLTPMEKAAYQWSYGKVQQELRDQLNTARRKEEAAQLELKKLVQEAKAAVQAAAKPASLTRSGATKASPDSRRVVELRERSRFCGEKLAAVQASKSGGGWSVGLAACRAWPRPPAKPKAVKGRLLGSEGELCMTAGLTARLQSLRRLLCHPSLESEKNGDAGEEKKPPAMNPEDALSSLLRDVTAQVELSRSGVAKSKGAKRRKEESKLADLVSRQAYLAAKLSQMRAPPRPSGEEAAAAGVSAAQQDDDSQCSVCLEGIDDPCLTPCGHVFCYECIVTSVRSLGASGKCPICREPLQECNLMRLHLAEDDLSDDGPMTCKVQHIVNDVTRLKAEAAARGEPFKCVVFSQWSKLLDVLHRALHVASIQAAALYGASEAREAAILSFQQSAEVVVLLVNMRGTQSSGAAGLTLTEANVGYLMEPCLNFGLEQQAIGRMNRIGQKKRVTIKRLVCAGTIEEGLLQVAKRKKALVRGGDEEEALIEAEIADMFGLTRRAPAPG